jgi:hypothetical protein
MSESSSNDELYKFLVGLGTAEIAHTGHDFLTHLKAVQRVLEDADADPEIARAGLFHSIYGTEGFHDFSLPLEERERVRSLLGDRAEFTAYCNCVMDRSTFDAAVASSLADSGATFEIRDRAGSPPIALTRAQLTDLAEVHLFDWLEQVHRSDRSWDYRREAYRQMAELVGPRAVRAYEAKFAQEAAAT